MPSVHVEHIMRFTTLEYAITPLLKITKNIQ